MLPPPSAHDPGPSCGLGRSPPCPQMPTSPLGLKRMGGHVGCRISRHRREQCSFCLVTSACIQIALLVLKKNLFGHSNKCLLEMAGGWLAGARF